MMSDDLGFLLIFIVLPTVLIVSGIWMAIFIRRDFSARPSVQRHSTPNAADVDSDRDREESWAAALDEDAAADVEHDEPGTVEPAITIASVPADRDADLREDEPEAHEAPAEPTTVDPDALEGAEALAAALLNDADEHDTQSIDATLPQVAEPATSPAAVRGEEDVVDVEAGAVGGHTAELEPLSQPEVDPGTVEPFEPGAPLPDESPAASGRTEPLPESHELGLSEDSKPGEQPALDEDDRAEDESEDDSSASGRRRRQPEARLTRSTQNVRRRGRSTGRRVPPIVRPGLRDEDAVERKDGS